MKTPAAAKSPVVTAFERRADRAQALARDADAARAPLTFAAGLYRVQASIAGRIEREEYGPALSGHLEADALRLFDGLREVLRYAAESGPDALSEAAAGRAEEDEETGLGRLRVYWDGGPEARGDYLSRAMLRPYVEMLRSINRAPDRVHRRGRCPFCGGAPWVGARRDASEMEGARRMLACSLCGGEWPFDRILCPACLEEDPRKLPIFQSDRYPVVRIETCETCRRYVKSIDLSLDARPIPEIDDLLSLSMDLWAVEEGYTRIEPGLAGI